MYLTEEGGTTCEKTSPVLGWKKRREHPKSWVETGDCRNHTWTNPSYSETHQSTADEKRKDLQRAGGHT